MPTPGKIAKVEDISARMRAAAAVYFADYRGLSAGQATELRGRLREQKVEFTVVKKTLTRLAAQAAGLGEIDDFLQGQTALAFTYDDPAAPARMLRDFGKGNQDIPVITGLILDGQHFPAAKAMEIAALPAKDVLLAQLVMVLQQPATKLASTLNGVMTKLALTLASLNDQKTS